MENKDIHSEGIAAKIEFRLPGEDIFHELLQHTSPLRLASLSELNGKSGYVISPFKITNNTPLLLLQPDEEYVRRLPQMADRNTVTAKIMQGDAKTNRQKYAESFSIAMAGLKSGLVDKVVLSRQQELAHSMISKNMRHEMFINACHLFRHSYVAMWSCPDTGTWLVATPEVILRKSAHGWHTMALAGTCINNTEGGTEGCVWSKKNMDEHQYVIDFIAEGLAPWATNIQKSATYTSPAAHISHLRTDFSFNMKPGVGVGDVLSSLHPTPAVCGIPRMEAFKLIEQAEPVARSYYSGFSGPLSMQAGTNLYVTLRCMQMGAERSVLYAGGGLLRESIEQDEWAETGSKMQTMINLFTI